MILQSDLASPDVPAGYRAGEAAQHESQQGRGRRGEGSAQRREARCQSHRTEGGWQGSRCKAQRRCEASEGICCSEGEGDSGEGEWEGGEGQWAGRGEEGAEGVRAAGTDAGHAARGEMLVSLLLPSIPMQGLCGGGRQMGQPSSCSAVRCYRLTSCRRVTSILARSLLLCSPLHGAINHPFRCIPCRSTRSGGSTAPCTSRYPKAIWPRSGALLRPQAYFDAIVC